MYKRLIVVALALLVAVTANAQFKSKKDKTASTPMSDEWNDVEIFEQNKLYPRANVVPYSDENGIEKWAYAKSPYLISLNGDWKCKVETVASSRINPEVKDFTTEGWSPVAVPSNLLEVDGQNYKMPKVKSGHGIPSEGNPVATYYREFDVPKAWSDYDAYLSLQARSAYYVWVNQEFVGYSEDSRTFSEFNITQHLNYGKKNNIVIQVVGMSDGSLLEMNQDRSLMGITGDVAIMLKPVVNVQDMKITADYNASTRFGQLKADLNVENLTKKGQVYVEVVVWDPQGRELDKTGRWIVFDKKKEVQTSIEMEFGKVSPWSAESPSLYTVVVRLRNEKMQLVETTGSRFGFRTIEVKNGQLLVNGAPVTLRGVTYTGYDYIHNGLSTIDQMRTDLKMMKQNNINAVHTTIYSPANPAFYEMCDEYGLYVISDANLQPYSKVGKAVATDKDYMDIFIVRVQNMYECLKNHPSIIAWSLGSCLDNGVCMENAYRTLKQKDKTRPVIFSGAEYSENTDVIASRNIDKDDMKVFAAKTQSRPLILYTYGSSQGNNFGGMESYWNLVRTRSAIQGGFMSTWDTYRYFNTTTGEDAIESGLLTRSRTAVPYLAELRNIYRPFNVELISLTPDHGEFTVTNYLDFLSLNDYILEYNIFSNLKPRIVEGEVNVDLAPGESKAFKLKVPKLTLYSGEELFIRFTVRQRRASNAVPKSTELSTVQFPLPMNEVKRAALPEYDKEEIYVTEDGSRIHIYNANIDMWFDMTTADMVSYRIDDKELLAGTPRLNFYRSPTDNDRVDLNGSKLWQQLNPDNLERAIVACAYRQKDKYTVGIDAMLRYTDRSGNLLFDVKQSYNILYTGDILLDNQIVVSDQVRVLPRVGYQFQIAQQFDTVQWLGFDKETYADRRQSGIMGTHKMVADSIFFPYDRPQSSGNRSEVHWLSLENGTSGLFIDMLDTNFCFSIAPYDDMQLVKAVDFSNIKPKSYWTLNVDYRQTGIGSALVGMDIDDEYILTERDFAFRLHLHAFNYSENEPQDFRRIRYPDVETNVLPMPTITKSADRFDKPMTITLTSTVPGTELRYTTDGTTPSETSTLYKKPFTISHSTIVQAKAFKKGYTASFTAQGRFNFDHITAVTYEHTPNTPYNLNPQTALFDGETGAVTNLETGWTGFSGTDFNAVFTLGKSIDLQDVVMHFAHVPDAWAFAPTSVAIYTSADGEVFDGPIYAKIKYDPASVEMKSAQLITIRIPVEKTDVRYVRVVARNLGKIPVWHKYKGLRPWLMVDEVQLNEVIK